MANAPPQCAAKLYPKSMQNQLSYDLNEIWKIDKWKSDFQAGYKLHLKGPIFVNKIMYLV